MSLNCVTGRPGGQCVVHAHAGNPTYELPRTTSDPVSPKTLLDVELDPFFFFFLLCAVTQQHLLVQTYSWALKAMSMYTRVPLWVFEESRSWVCTWVTKAAVSTGHFLMWRYNVVGQTELTISQFIKSSISNKIISLWRSQRWSFNYR